MVGICFSDVLIFVYVYVYGCKYHHEISYKSPIRGMVIILSCCHDVFHVSLLKRYVQDVDYVIDWFIL